MPGCAGGPVVSGGSVPAGPTTIVTCVAAGVTVTPAPAGCPGGPIPAGTTIVISCPAPPAAQPPECVAGYTPTWCPNPGTVVTPPAGCPGGSSGGGGTGTPPGGGGSGTGGGTVTPPTTPPSDKPIIAVYPSALSFPAEAGGANPAAQTVTVANVGGSALSWTTKITVYSPHGGSWLSASSAGTNSFSVGVSVSGLAVGTYTGSLQISGTGAINSPQSVGVTLQITAPAGKPAIAVSPRSLMFVTTVGTNPSSQSFNVQSIGTGAAGWTASVSTGSGDSWLSVSPASGVAPSSVTVLVNASKLAKGGYSGTVTITPLPSSNASSGPQAVGIGLAVDSPAVPENGVVNGASFSKDAVVSPGSISSLFGLSLASQTAAASSVPLPTTLGGTQVLVNGRAAPMFYVSPLQINFQMPSEVTSSTAQVTVVSGNTPGLTATVNADKSVPGVFTFTPGGAGQAAVLNEDFSQNSNGNAAKAGSVIQIFATGLGATNPAAATGQTGATSEPLNRTAIQPEVTIDGASADVLFSGLAPGFVGLYQLNVRVPTIVPNTTASLKIYSSGRSSNAASIAVK